MISWHALNKSFESLCAKSCVKLLVEMFYYLVKRDCCSNPEVYECPEYIWESSPEGCECIPDRVIVVSEPRNSCNMLAAALFQLGNSQWQTLLDQNEAQRLGFCFTKHGFHLKQCQLKAWQGSVIKCHSHILVFCDTSSFWLLVQGRCGVTTVNHSSLSHGISQVGKDL